MKSNESSTVETSSGGEVQHKIVVKDAITHSDTSPPDSENTAVPGAEGGKDEAKRVEGSRGGGV